MTGRKENGNSDGSNEVSVIQYEKPNSKPAAFLQGLNKVAGPDGVMHWQKDGLAPFVRGLVYIDGSLKVQDEGYYYVYSKVYFAETCSLFRHQVKRRSRRYSNAPTDLMQSRRYSCVDSEKQEDEDRADVGNSFLGGVFLLYRGDSVYVQVNNSSLIQVGIYDNFFGLFMI